MTSSYLDPLLKFPAVPEQKNVCTIDSYLVQWNCSDIIMYSNKNWLLFQWFFQNIKVYERKRNYHYRELDLGTHKGKHEHGEKESYTKSSRNEYLFSANKLVHIGGITV